MKKSIRYVAFLLAILMMAVSLSGCGEKEIEGVTKGAKVNLNGKEIYPIECEDTLTFWFSATAIWESKYENFAETPIGQELKKQTGINVEYIHPSGGQGEEQFQLLLAADELPDMVNNNWYSYSGGPEVAIADEYIYQLNEIFDAYCPGITKLIEEHPQWARAMRTDNGMYYAFLPVNAGDPIPSTYGPVLRADWLKKLNMEAPRNIGEWEKVLTAFKEEIGAKIPFTAGRSAMMQAFGPAFGIYNSWYIDDGKVKFGEYEPGYKEYLVTMNRWYKNGLIDGDFYVSDNKKHQSNVLNGNTGSFMAWMGSGLGQFLEATNGKDGFDLVAAQFPAVGTGTGKAEYSYGSQAVSNGVSTAISKRCKNVELAARFLDFGYTEKGHAVYNFGTEGLTYEWVDKDGEKYPQFTDHVYKNSEGLTISEVLHMNTRACHSNVPMITDPRFTEQFYPFKQQKDALVKWSDSNMSEHILPGVYISSEQSDEDGTIMASVNTYANEMAIKFIIGERPIEEFDDYIKTLKDFGIEKAIAFRQEALERYNNR